MMLIVITTILSLSILTSSVALGQQQEEQQPIPVPTEPTVFKMLPKSNTTTLGIEPENKDNWITANHDILEQEIVIRQLLERIM